AALTNGGTGSEGGNGRSSPSSTRALGQAPTAAPGAPGATHETRDSIADIWGPRTPHLGSWPVRVDGNTRLCTATAANALIESFGTDGAPGSYTDFDTTDAIFLV